MAFYPTDPAEIRSIILSLKTNSAPGWDRITAGFLKQYVLCLAEPIAGICNLSLETGTFPSAFKHAEVCPVFKNGDKSSPSNYRPISLLSTLSKVLEKLVKKRLMKYLEQNDLLNNKQYGFRQGRSTEDAVLTLTSLITSYVDGGYKAIGVFLDLQKAFDTVSIPILITRLENIGVRGIALDWFKDYLTGRTQLVKIDNYKSDRSFCNYGVPQGSTLGPTLFLVYINELCTMTLPGLDLLMFADDTVLLLHERTWPKVTGLAEKCLSAVTHWLENSLLTLNASKTKFMCFSKTSSGDPGNGISLKMHTFPCNRGTVQAMQCCCAVLSRVGSIRYLGVHIDDKLNWSTHIALLTSRIRKLIYVFKNLREVADPKLVVQTYKALCECLIRYCICAWGSAAKTYLITAERAQRAVLKVLQYLPYRHPTTAVYEKADVLSVRKLYIYESIRRYHKKTVPILPDRNTRRDLCPVPFVKSSFAQKKYDVIVPKLYNTLNKNNNIKILNHNSIKKTIITWLKTFDYDGVEEMLNNFYY